MVDQPVQPDSEALLQPDRLAQIEAILLLIANRQDRTQQQIDQSFNRLDRIEQIVESNSRAIKANTNAIAETRVELRANIEDLTNTLGTYAAQAEQDRIALTASVRSLVEALQNRFGGNGHGGQP